MKIAFIMGRGVEGCGVTKFTLEQNDWFLRQGIESTIYSPKDKSWTRKNSHDCSTIQTLKFAKDEEANIVIKGCNEADAVIIYIAAFSIHTLKHALLTSKTYTLHLSLSQSL